MARIYASTHFEYTQASSVKFSCVAKALHYPVEERFQLTQACNHDNVEDHDDLLAFFYNKSKLKQLYETREQRTEYWDSLIM